MMQQKKFIQWRRRTSSILPWRNVCFSSHVHMLFPSQNWMLITVFIDLKTFCWKWIWPCKTLIKMIKLHTSELKHAQRYTYIGKATQASYIDDLTLLFLTASKVITFFVSIDFELQIYAYMHANESNTAAMIWFRHTVHILRIHAIIQKHRTSLE